MASYLVAGPRSLSPVDRGKPASTELLHVAYLASTGHQLRKQLELLEQVGAGAHRYSTDLHRVESEDEEAPLEVELAEELAIEEAEN